MLTSNIANQTGKLKIKLPLHRDIIIPLENNDAERLADKLNLLIPKAKKQEWERIIREKTRTRHLKRKLKKTRPSSYTTVPYYFPTEQVDIVNKLERKRKRSKK